MSEEPIVRFRYKIGDQEIEVEGPEEWVDSFVEGAKKSLGSSESLLKQYEK